MFKNNVQRPATTRENAREKNNNNTNDNSAQAAERRVGKQSLRGGVNDECMSVYVRQEEGYICIYFD